MRLLILLAAFALLVAPGLGAHHGSSEYHVDREIRITGTVARFRWVNPHVRIVLDVTGKDGRTSELDCEGPPLTWAAQRGWSQATLRAGEKVTLVMYPARIDGRGGLVKRIERSNGEALAVSRPWLDGP